MVPFIGVIDKESEMKVASIYLIGQLLCSAATDSIVKPGGNVSLWLRGSLSIFPPGHSILLEIWMIRIWNRALSSEEIQGLFDGIPPVLAAQ